MPLTLPKPTTITVEKPSTKIAVSTEEESQIIVHCSLNNPGPVRIWRSTYLVDNISNHKSIMLHCEGISLFPHWQESNNFTLYFAPLPKDCTIFHLIEDIPEEGGFRVPFIVRNEQDVYWVEI